MAIRGFTLCVLCLLVFSYVNAKSPVALGKRTLVLLDGTEIKTSHSQFFKQLEERGHVLKYAVAGEDEVDLRRYGEYLYDNLVLFAPTADDFGKFSSDDVLHFVDAGGNLLLAGSLEISDAVRDLANECGVEFDDEDTVAIDHAHAHPLDSDFEGEHTVFSTKNILANSVVLGTKNIAPVVFHGVAHALIQDNPHIFSVVGGEATTYSGDPEHEIGSSVFVSGRSTGLVSAMQARNNARVAISGSLDVFSNRFFDLAGSGNADLARELTRWVFGERGVLRFTNATHWLAEPFVSPVEPLHSDIVGCRRHEMYTINDVLGYSITISELVDGEWVPYKANDVQLEWAMLSPYIRTNLKDQGNGVFSTEFKAADVYGVFKFRVDYRRQGYSAIYHEASVPVRPLRHNQFERFILQAYPYYSSAFSMMVGLFLFSWVFLYTK
eukprot:TRINITY_DN1419_c0_g1::TRINITY_DN1419_c0_g1_i1::g.27119::m.27119 TRINITY_DN1419_c0_g1::TRINITY_DN1419_c0_g1_i1::g.27119  ORF type:complete len:448 (+),score=71.06,sp/O54734/OST48_MOUSE/42.92/1e-121,DDOST_48kD/PF03345.9/4.7e-121 TRINITY_DN1419_c0_g1_i1:33-1346(+)